MGLPEHFGRRKKDLFNLIVDRIRQRAICCSSKNLSSAGKMVLLKFILASMPTYTMSCFKLPASLCKRIQSTLTRFLWDSDMEKKNICCIAWDKLTRSKKAGGLGFRDIQCFSDALLAKVSWRILTNPECLMAKILLGKYCHSSPFLESSLPNSSSHGWGGIMIGKELMKQKLGKVIGNGKTTKVWNDPWLSLSKPLQLFGPPNKNNAEMLVAGLFLLDKMEWNLEKIEALLPGLEHNILELKPSVTGAEDKFSWLGHASGIYSARSGYHTAKERASPT